jgi:PST family polysaccharide transporter
LTDVAPTAPAAAPHRLAQIKAMILTTGATVTNVGLNLVRTKVVAELLGPSGTAVVSQLGNISGVTGVLATLGIPAAVIQRVAAADGRGDREAGARTVATATLLFVVLALVVALGQIAGTPWLLPLLGGAAHGSWLLLAIALGIPLATAGSLFTAALNGRRFTRATVTAGVVGALLAACAAFPLTWLAGVRGAVAALVAISLGSAVYGLVALKRDAPDLFRAVLKPRRLAARSELGALIRFGVPSIFAGILPMLAQLAVRTIVVTRAGTDAAGLFQSAMAFSQQYAGLFLGSVGVYLMPALSATQTAETLSLETERSLLLLLEIGTPVILIAMAAYDIVLPVAYSRRFLGAGLQLQIQLAADVAKIASWHFAITLIARGEIRAFLFVEAVGAAALVAFMAVFMPLAPRAAGGLAFAATYAVYLVTTYLVARWRCGLRISGRGWRALALAMLVTGAALAVALTCGRGARAAVGALAAAVLVFSLRRLAVSGALKNALVRRLFRQRS